MMLMVPDDKVGIIIGKGGATVKDIQNRLNVKIQIPQQPDIGSNPPVRTISIAGPSDMQPQAKYEIEMIVAGTPLHGGGGQQQYGYGGNAWDQQSAYGMGAGGYYGAQTNPYDMQAYMQQPYAAMAAYYGAGAAVNPYMAQAGYAVQEPAAAAVPEAVPSDPTAYYNDYWQYATYYGEAAARIYYGAWSPPEGTPPPAGVVVPPPPAADAPLPPPLESADSVPQETQHQQPSEAVEQQKDVGATAKATEEAAELDPEAAAAAWETYKKQACLESHLFNFF